MKDHLRILKYLFEKDNGEFLDVTNAFSIKNTPRRERIEQIYIDLHKYIETESIYNYRGLASLEDKEIPETPLLKARIKQDGRDYYIEHKNKNISITISKRNLWIAIALLVIAALTFYFTVVNPINNRIKKVRIDETNFPNPVLCLKNNTKDTVYFYSRQNFILWFPETVLGGAPNLTGKYEFIDTSNMINGLHYISPAAEIKIGLKIENKNKFYYYFTQNENDLMLWLRTSNGKLHYSTTLPFNKKWISQYCLGINIEEKTTTGKKLTE